jgi:ABC-type transporter Mla subunit MlaD
MHGHAVAVFYVSETQHAGEDSMVKDTRQRRRVLYGGLLIAGLVSTAVLIFFLDDIVDAFRKNYEITALVPDAPGIASGTPVWVGGREVGIVRTVAILPTSLDTLGRVAVTLELPTGVQEQVRKDSRIRITAISMMSPAAIDIVPGTAAAPRLAPGDTLRLEVRPSAQQIAARAAALRKEMDTVFGALAAISPVASARMEQTRRVSLQLEAAMAEVQQVRAELAANPGVALLNDPAFRASIERARAQVAGLPALFASAQERAASTADVRLAFGQLQVRADTLAAQLAAAAALLDNPDGFIGRSQQDTALARAVNGARLSLDSLMAEVRRNPLRFVF